MGWRMLLGDNLLSAFLLAPGDPTRSLARTWEADSRVSWPATRSTPLPPVWPVESRFARPCVIQCRSGVFECLSESAPHLAHATISPRCTARVAIHRIARTPADTSRRGSFVVRRANQARMDYRRQRYSLAVVSTMISSKG